jgi:5-methylcytosine-specific restriction enzyme A
MRKLTEAEREANGGNLCRDPYHTGDPHVAKVELDHIKEITDGGAPFDPANLIFRCLTCHRQKTAAAARKRFVLANLR